MQPPSQPLVLMLIQLGKLSMLGILLIGILLTTREAREQQGDV